MAAVHDQHGYGQQTDQHCVPIQNAKMVRGRAEVGPQRQEEVASALRGTPRSTLPSATPNSSASPRLAALNTTSQKSLHSGLVDVVAQFDGQPA